MLILAPISSVGVKFSPEKNFIMLDQFSKEIKNGVNGEPYDGLYFTNGDWYDNFDSNLTSDNRIAEFHSSVPGFVFGGSQNESDVVYYYTMFLKSPSRVIIFYPDQPPQLGPSEAIPLGMQRTSTPNNELHINFEILKKQYESIYELNNQLPFTRQIVPVTVKNARITNILGYLKILSSGENPEKTKEKFTVNYSEDSLKMFISELSNLMADSYVLKKGELMEVKNIRESNDEDLDKRNEIAKIILEKIDSNSENFINLFNYLRYFCEKTMRNFFFSENSDFLRILFNNFTEEKNLEVLFQENIAPLGSSILFDFENASFFERDDKFEDKMDYLVEKKEKKWEKEQYYYWFQRTRLFDAFQKLIFELQPTFDPENTTEFKFEYSIFIQKNESLSALFGVFERSLLSEFFSNFMGIVYNSFINGSIFKSIDIGDFSTPEGVNLIRNYLLVLGKVDLNTGVSSDHIEYYPVNIFSQATRMILI